MADMNPRQVIEAYDDYPGRDRAGNPNGSAVIRTILYANGTVEIYEFDDRNPPPSGDMAWGTRVNSRVDAGQKRNWDEEVKAQKDADEVKIAPNVKNVTLTARVRQSDGSTLPIGTYVAADPKTGKPLEDENGDFTVVGATAATLKGLGAGGGGSGGSTRVRFPDEIAENQAQVDNIRSQIAEREATLPGDMERTASQTALSNQQLEDLKRKALPAQQQLIQQAQSTIEYIKGQIAAGTMTTVQGDDYYGKVNEYLKAGLQGSTPYEMYQDEQKKITDRAKMGQELLQQRISSGASLAGNMYGDYSSTLTANGGLLVNPGPYNPVEHAKQTVTDLGGGEGTFDMAKSLMAPLMSGGGGQGAGAMNTNPAIRAILDGGGAATVGTGAILDSGIVESNGQQSDGEVTFTPEQEAWFAEQEAVV